MRECVRERGIFGCNFMELIDFYNPFQVSCQQFMGVMLFENCRLLIGGIELLSLFPTNNYIQHIRMMLLWDDLYREIHFFSLGELVNVVVKLLLVVIMLIVISNTVIIAFY